MLLFVISVPLCGFIKNITQSRKEHKVMQCFSGLCGVHKKFHTEPQRTQRAAKLLFVFSVPLCGVHKKFHTKPQRTQRAQCFSLCFWVGFIKNFTQSRNASLCVLCAFVWVHKKYHTEPQRRKKICAFDKKLSFFSVCRMIFYGKKRKFYGKYLGSGKKHD